VASVSSADWPTTKFSIQNISPDSYAPEALQRLSGSGFSGPQGQSVAKLQRYLHEIANRYQALGFRAPDMPQVELDNGETAYLVYMYNYSDSDRSAKVRQYEDLSTNLRLDLSRTVSPDGSIAPDAYDNLAHELFHTVQRAYQVDYDADLGDWIMEGQAQAMGMEFAWTFRCVDIHKGKEDDFRLGGRPYFRPITTAPFNDDYRTASFWRYLAERLANTTREGCDGVREVAADYSYLATLYAQPWVLGGKQIHDLEWLDTGLRKAFGVGLARLYANFTATLAAYVPERLTLELTRTPEEARNAWLGRLFEPCSELNLTATQPNPQADLSVDYNAARCVTVRLFGEGTADISFHIRAAARSNLDALRIGTAGGEKVGSPHRIESPVGGGYLGTWEFSIEAGKPQTFVVSNMADLPFLTLAYRGAITAGTDFWESNITPARQQAAPSPGAGAASGTGTRETSRARAERELEASLAAPANRSTLGSTLSYDWNRPRCAEPFGATGCGPIMGIRLNLASGTPADPWKITGTGEATGQFMSQLTAIADHGVFATDRALDASLQAMEDTQGGWIDITIPAVEYGFSGSFDNAMITVNGGKGSGKLEARGPMDSQPGRGFNFWHSGSVTIDEFTPLILRGSFSAQLTDMSRIDFDALGEDPTLPVDRNIQGRFVISSPWKADPAVEVLQAEGPEGAEQVRQDMAEAFPESVNFDLDERRAAAGSGDGSGQSIGIGKLDDFPACSCSCQLADIPKNCRATCKPMVLACGQERQRVAALEAAGKAPETGSPADLAGQRAELPTREEYIAGLRAEGIPESQIEHLVSQMDEFMAENGGWPQK
jgi:hypothetical protein